MLHFDVQLVRPVILTLAGFDIGTAFRQLQKGAVAFVNDKNQVSICRFERRMAYQYVFRGKEVQD